MYTLIKHVFVQDAQTKTKKNLSLHSGYYT